MPRYASIFPLDDIICWWERTGFRDWLMRDNPGLDLAANKMFCNSTYKSRSRLVTHNGLSCLLLDLVGSLRFVNQRAHELQTFEIFPGCVSSSAQVLLLPNLGFLSRPTCLPPVLAGGSTVNSSSQLQLNKSWSRIPVNCCRAAPRPDSQSQPGLHWRGVFRNQLELSRSVSCWAKTGIREIAGLQRHCECSWHNPVLSTF